MSSVHDIRAKILLCSMVLDSYHGYPSHRTSDAKERLKVFGGFMQSNTGTTPGKFHLGRDFASVATTIAVTLCMTACFSSGTGNKDRLRNPVSATGISVGLQVNLEEGRAEANAAASIYKNGVRQPLVGGDFFSATSMNDGDSAVLRSIENLGGSYVGQVGVMDGDDQVLIATEFDPERAREDRWYPVDELLVNPGPNEDLVGYQETFGFPEPLEGLSINQTTFTQRSDDVVVSWTPAADATGMQITSNSVVTCYSTSGRSYSYPSFDVLNVLDTDNGTITLRVGDIIPSELVLETVFNLVLEVYTIISAAILETYTFGLFDSSDIEPDTFTLDRCDVEMTVFREVGFELPEGVEGGFAIGSSSDTISYTYTVTTL